MINLRIDLMFENTSLYIKVGLAGNVRNKHFSSTGWKY